MKYYKALEDLIECFQMYPGIGPKTAERLAFFTIQKCSKEDVEKFSECLIEINKKTKKCAICGCYTDMDICDICKDEHRDNTLLVVSDTRDIVMFEKTGQYYGKYHTLNGLISLTNGTTSDDINLDKLTERVKNENISEVIIAISGSMDGEITAQYIKILLEKEGVNVTRIGYGLPAGGDIEYADEVTLIKALEGRTKM